MKKIVLFIISFCILCSCSDRFEEINRDNDNVTKAPAYGLLPEVLIKIADRHINNNYALGNVVSQYVAKLQYNEIDIYRWTPNSDFWGYYNQFQNIKDIIEYGNKNNQKQYTAVGQLLKAYLITQITDAYGPAPYSEAAQADNGIYLPKYDSQEAIYTQLNQELTEINLLFAQLGNAELKGDALYNGDIKKWRKWCNSLRLRVLAKMMNKVDKKQEFSTIVSNPSQYPIFESNADNAIHSYAGTGINVSPLSKGRGRQYEFDITSCTTTMKKLMDKWNDPRILAWYDAPADNPGVKIAAVNPGELLQNIPSNSKLSQLSISFYSDPGKLKAIYMTYSELEFLLAEAAEKGWITGNPKNFYDQGVKASFDYWKVVMPQDYLTKYAPYTFPDPQLIAQQKWVAYFWNGVEAWNDLKRTGNTSIIQKINSDPTANMPVRVIYPSIEQSINPANYQNALSALGGKDDIYSKSWWNK